MDVQIVVRDANECFVYGEMYVKILQQVTPSDQHLGR